MENFESVESAMECSADQVGTAWGSRGLVEWVCDGVFVDLFAEFVEFADYGRFDADREHDEAFWHGGAFRVGVWVFVWGVSSAHGWECITFCDWWQGRLVRSVFGEGLGSWFWCSS